MRILILCLLLLPAMVSARDWSVDMSNSVLGFDGTYQGGKFFGKFKQWNAIIRYDESDLAQARFDVTVQLSSVDTGSSERDQTLATADFFDTAKYPQARFLATRFFRGADGSVIADGMLTLRDRSRPVSLKVKFAATGGATTLDVATTLKRLDFGLGSSADWADISADIHVHGHLVLQAK